MNKLALLTSLILALVCFEMQAQTLAEMQEMCTKSKATWAKIKKECGDTYSYTLTLAFMPSLVHHELTVDVKDGKVAKTTLKEFTANKLTKTKTDLVKTFHDQPVGTLDDIYQKAENEVFKLNPADYIINFRVDKQNLVSGLVWASNTALLVDQQAPGYSISSIKWKKAKAK